MMTLSHKRVRREALRTHLFFYTCVFLFLLVATLLSGQEILTAENYLEKISVQYSQIEDYQAMLTITQEEDVMEGTVYYKKPNLLRINFEDPEEQVLVIDGKSLTIYIPKHSVIMHQNLKESTEETGAAMASEQGLQLLRSNYSVAYLEGPDPVPLDEGSDEMVTKLSFNWRSTDAGFREIKMAVGENGLIRRIIGVTVDYEEVQFDFDDILLNQNIPEARFEYDSPSSANIFKDFLFEPDY